MENVFLKRLLVILSVLWVGVFAMAGYSLLPIAWPKQANREYNENTLLIEYQATTGSPSVVLNGHKSITEYYEVTLAEKREAPYEIALIGRLPSDLIAFPSAYDSQYVVYGKIVGMTGQYREAGSGNIPVFEVISWKPTAYLPRLWASTSTDYRNMLRITLVVSPGLLLLTLFALLQDLYKKRQQRQNQVPWKGEITR